MPVVLSLAISDENRVLVSQGTAAPCSPPAAATSRAAKTSWLRRAARGRGGGGDWPCVAGPGQGMFLGDWLVGKGMSVVSRGC